MFLPPEDALPHAHIAVTAAAAVLAATVVASAPALAGPLGHPHHRHHHKNKAVPSMRMSVSPKAHVADGSSLDASVVVRGSNGPATGLVSISLPGRRCTKQLVLGRAHCSLGDLAASPGRHVIRAVYDGSRKYRTAKATAPVSVSRATTSIAVSTSPNGTTAAGTPATFTATLADAHGHPADHGAVSFSDGSRAMSGCTHVGVARGAASCTATLPTGRHQVSVTYSGSALFAPARATVSYTVVASKPLAISTRTLPNADLYSRYSSKLEASGGAAPYSWKLIDSELPRGLTFARSGALAGTPKQAGRWTLIVEVRDAHGKTASRILTLRVIS